MNSLEMSVSNMDFVHALFSESRYPPFGLQLEQRSVLLLLALLMQWMDAEPTVNDKPRTLGSCMPPVTF